MGYVPALGLSYSPAMPCAFVLFPPFPCRLGGIAKPVTRACYASDKDLERVATLRARESAAARLQRFGEARAARAALVAALSALPEQARVIEANEQFYEAWRRADEIGMMRRWAPHGLISAVFAFARPFIGQDEVHGAWGRLFSQGPPAQLEYKVRNVRISESGTAWVIVDQKLRVRRAPELPAIATNVYRKVGAEWLLLLHHSSPLVDPTQVEEQPPPAQA